MNKTINRRTLVKGAAWAAPVVAATSVVPVYAASKSTGGSTYPFDLGIFVSATDSNTSTNGPALGTSVGNITASGPSSLAASFTGGTPYSLDASGLDRNFSVSTGRASSCGSQAINGAGKATPTGMGSSAGSYAMGNYFWFSSPSSAVGTGSGYSGTTTLAAGATFVTTVSYTVPAGTSSSLLYPTLGDNSTWNTALSKSMATVSGQSYAPAVKTIQVAASVAYSAPSVKTNSDGSVTFSGTITVTTTAAVATNNSATTDNIVQVSLLGPLKFPNGPAGATLSTTSAVQSAVLTTSSGKSVTVTGQAQTASITTCS